jgi:hypothetical protein
MEPDAGRSSDAMTQYAGTAFVLAFLLGAVLLGDMAGSFGDPDSQFVAIHEARSDRIGFVVGGYALTFAGIAFIWFIVSLTEQLRSTGDDVLVAIARISGGAFATLLLGAAAAFMTVAASITMGDVFGDDGQFETAMSAMPQLGYVLFHAGAMLAFSSTVVATSMLLRGASRGRVWLRRFGFVTALLLPLSVFSPLLVLLPAWVLAASVLAWRDGPG